MFSEETPPVNGNSANTLSISQRRFWLGTEVKLDVEGRLVASSGSRRVPGYWLGRCVRPENVDRGFSDEPCAATSVFTNLRSTQLAFPAPATVFRVSPQAAVFGKRPMWPPGIFPYASRSPPVVVSQRSGCRLPCKHHVLSCVGRPEYVCIVFACCMKQGTKRCEVRSCARPRLQSVDGS